MNSENCDIESDLIIVQGTTNSEENEIIVPETPEKVIDSKENEIIVPETPENELPESTKGKEDISKIIEETPEQTNKSETFKELIDKYLQGKILSRDEQRKVHNIFNGKSCIPGRKCCKGRHPIVSQQKAPTNFSFRGQPAVSQQNPFDLRQPRGQPAVSQQNPFDFPLGGQPAVGPWGCRQTEIPNSNPSDVWRQFKRNKRIEHSQLVTVAETFCTDFLDFFSEQKLNESEYATQKALFDKMLKFCIRQGKHRDIIQEARKYCIDYLEDYYPRSERNKEKQAKLLFMEMMELCQKHVI